MISNKFIINSLKKTGHAVKKKLVSVVTPISVIF